MRYLDSFIQKDIEKQMILLSGPRQCGKTTFAKWLLAEHFDGEYLNWDQTKDRKKILAQDWSDQSQLIVLDEIHKKKNWKNFIKGIYDTKPKSMRLLITGSARLELFQKSGDSMMGRFRPWRMHPFCLSEDPLNLPLQERFSRLLNQGNFPIPYLSDDSSDIQRWRNQRWSLLLREDLRDLESIKDINSLELLAELLKNVAGGMISYANLAEDVEVSPKTLKRWVLALEKLYLIFLLSPYTGSLKRMLSKTPKLYFMDTGDLGEQSVGARVENLVALNLLKRVNFIEDAYGDKIGLCYLRDKEGHEVDFGITIRRKLVALIEVKTGDREISKSLLYFKSKTNPVAIIQLHADAKEPLKVKNGVKIMSIQEFFSSPVTTREFWV